MGISTCNMCNQQATKCSCVSSCNPNPCGKICRVPVSSILVNGLNANQDVIEFIGETIGQAVVPDDGCGGSKLEVRIPGLIHNVDEQTLDIYNADGTVSSIDLAALGIDIFVDEASFDNATSTITFIDNSDDQGQTTPDIQVDVSGLRAILTDNGDGTYTIDNGLGNTILISQNALDIAYDNTASGLTSTNVNDAIDELLSTINSLDLDTSIVTNTNSNTNKQIIATHNDGDGNITNIEETIVTITTDVSGTQTIVTEDGTSVVINDTLSNFTSSVNPDGTTKIEHDNGKGVTFDFDIINGAINGLSLDSNGNAVLGNDVGSTLAQLTSDREIPLNGYDLNILGSTFSVYGNTNGVISKFLKTDLTNNNISVAFGKDLAPGNNTLIGFDNSVTGQEIGFIEMFGSTNTSLDNDTVGDLILQRIYGSVGIGTGTNNRVPISPTGNESKFYVRGYNGEDVVIDSGLDDYSGLVLSRLDGNSPKEDYSTATPLGYDNATGFVVPVDITEKVSFASNNQDIQTFTIGGWQSSLSKTFNSMDGFYTLATHPVDVPAIPFIAPVGYTWKTHLEFMCDTKIFDVGVQCDISMWQEFRLNGQVPVPVGGHSINTNQYHLVSGNASVFDLSMSSGQFIPNQTPTLNQVTIQLGIRIHNPDPILTQVLNSTQTHTIGYRYRGYHYLVKN